MAPQLLTQGNLLCMMDIQWMSHCPNLGRQDSLCLDTRGLVCEPFTCTDLCIKWYAYSLNGFSYMLSALFAEFVRACLARAWPGVSARGCLDRFTG